MMTLNDKVKLWDAINDYVIACGGDPSKHVHGNIPRMNAVVTVERVVGMIAGAAKGDAVRSVAPRYEHEAAIVARVAQVLDCRPESVRLGWRGGALDSIGPELCGDDIAALLRAGFSVSDLGWDVPADCAGEAVKDGEKR